MWLYDRERQEYRCQSPHNTAVISQYYTTLLEDGETDCLIEDVLSHNESKAKPIIDSLENGELLDRQQRANLSYFLAFLFTRTPRFEQEAHQITESLYKLIARENIPTIEAAERLLAKSGRLNSVTAESFHAFIHDGKYQIKGHRNSTLDLMIEQVKEIAKELAFMDWDVLHAPVNRLFITSDSPLGYLIPDGLRGDNRPMLGLLSEEITRVMPLTSRIALRIGSRGVGLKHLEASRQELGEINLAIAKESERFLIGSSKDHVRYVVQRSKVDTTKSNTRLKLESVAHPTDPTRSFIVCHRVTAENVCRPFDPKYLPVDP